MSMNFFRGNAPRVSDTIQNLEAKILNSMPVISQGAGNPSHTPTTANAIYYNTTSGDIYCWDNTNQVWKGNGA